MPTYQHAKVHFRPDDDPERPDADGYATVYDEVEILPSGWVECGSHPHGPQVFPPERIEEIDAGYRE